MEAVSVGAYFHFLSGKDGCDLLKKGSSDFTMDEHSLDCIAHTRTLRFRVNDYSHSHIEIGFAINIGNADAEIMFNHRHSRMINDRFDQGPPSTRNNQINVLIHLGHMSHGIAARFWNEEDTVFGQASAGCAGT